MRQALGDDTRFASERDGEDGFWVSFFIDSDEFWVMLPWERFEPAFGLQWLGWGLALRRALARRRVVHRLATWRGRSPR